VDDMVFLFESKVDAERVFRVLGKRLNKFGLEMHAAKSALLPFGSKTAEKASCLNQKVVS